MMNLKSILSVTLLFAMRANGHLHMENSSVSRQITDKCDLTARPQCSSDCSRILACVSRVETPIFSINCTASTPYCENGHCVATPGNCSIKAEKSSFLCTSTGVFPEPTDCSQSHACSEVGSHSIISECSDGKIFDSKLKVCVTRPLNYRRICRKINCNGVTNDFVSFPANPTFYAYCFTSATGVQHTYMYKCDDEVNKVFDIDTKKCRFNCKSIGYHADPLDCSSYYICNGLKFASRRVHCPPNYFFNGTVCLNSRAHCPAGSLVNMTTSMPIPMPMPVPMPMPTANNNSTVADEISATSDPMTEEVTDATTLSFSESSVTEAFTTSSESSITEEPTTDAPMSLSDNEISATEESTTMQSDALQMNMSSTKKPSIWKHMGLISVRVGRFLNIV